MEAPILATPAPAQQVRSRKTAAALTAGAAKLLATRPLEEISIADFVTAANSSTGSFYARFKSKEDFLLYLAEHALIKQILPEAQVALDPARFARKNLEARAAAGIGFIASVFAKHRAVLRPLTILMHSAEGAGAQAVARKFNEPLHNAFALLMLAAPELEDNKATRQALTDMTTWVGAALRQALLLREAPADSERARLTRELARCMTLYLRSKS